MSNPNDPAYPSREYFCGVTKRELFAAMAMQGILAHGTYGPQLVEVASESIIAADALLAELAKPTT